MRVPWLLGSVLGVCLLAALGCGAGEDDDEDDDDEDDDDTASPWDTDPGPDTDGGEDCDVTVDLTVPLQGAVDAYYRSAIEFQLSDADPTATVRSAIAGTTTVSADSETVYFTPNDPLNPSTDYTVTLDYCGGSAELSFATSALGTPLSDPTDLESRTYALDLADARVVAPMGIGSVLTSYLTQDLFVTVVDVTATEISTIGGVADGDEADHCDTTIEFGRDDFTEQPYFAIGPANAVLTVAGYEFDLADVVITGAFATDGSYFGGGTLTGTMDTRPLAPLLGEVEDEGAICDLALSFGEECEACPWDDEPFCLTLVLDEITAGEVVCAGGA